MAMKRIILAAAALAVSARADFPIQDMGPRTLGLQYGLLFRGEDITNSSVPSHETLHLLSLGYAPLPYLAFEGGLGLDQYSVDEHNAVSFQGDYGFSPAFGAILSSPYFADLVKVEGGVKAVYLNSSDDKGYRYSGFVSNPFLGATLSPSAYCDFEAGARLLFINGAMRGPGFSGSFANSETARGYFSFTLKSPAEHAFLSFDLDVSPSLDWDWSHGPREASLGFSFGTLLGWHGKGNEAKTPSPYFPAYQELKDKQKKMADEIQ